jgi:non-homologous end joining protein Ku
MANAVWTGSLSLRMVVVPVRLYPALTGRDPKVNLGPQASGSGS